MPNTNISKIEMQNIENKTAQYIESFSFGPNFEPELVGYKAENMIKTLIYMIAHTEKELINYFGVQEALLLVSLFSSTLICPELEPKASLYVELIDAMELEGSHEDFGVNRAVIIEKVEKLSSFQAFCLIDRCYRYYRLIKANGGCDQDLRILKRLFSITA